MENGFKCSFCQMHLYFSLYNLHAIQIFVTYLGFCQLVNADRLLILQVRKQVRCHNMLTCLFRKRLFYNVLFSIHYVICNLCILYRHLEHNHCRSVNFTTGSYPYSFHWCVLVSLYPSTLRNTLLSPHTFCGLRLTAACCI